VLRIGRLAGLLLGSMMLLAAPAQATYHLNMVNEVLLASSGGDSSVQFVEFLDRGGTEEQFTPAFAPYKLVIYDASGKMLGQQTLDPNGLRAAAAVGREYLVSTAGADTAFNVTGDEHLTVTLPAGAGQACFEGNTPPPTAVSCLTWGAITKPVPINMFGTRSANGPVPPNGESDQRQADGSILAACPTPKAPNTPKVCTTARPAFAGIAFAARTATIDSHGRALVRMRCPVGTDGFCQGRVTLDPLNGRGRFGSARFKISSAKTAAVAVKLSSAALRAARRQGKLKVLATALVHDAAGTSRTSTSRLTLVDSRSSHRRT
jgi:hypothetical protein